MIMRFHLETNCARLAKQPLCRSFQVKIEKNIILIYSIYFLENSQDSSKNKSWWNEFAQWK